MPKPELGARDIPPAFDRVLDRYREEPVPAEKLQRAREQFHVDEPARSKGALAETACQLRGEQFRPALRVVHRDIQQEADHGREHASEVVSDRRPANVVPEETDPRLRWNMTATVFIDTERSP